MNTKNDVIYSRYTILLNSKFETAIRSVNSFDVHRIHVLTHDGRSSVAEVVATPVITGVTSLQLQSDIKDILVPLISEHELSDLEDFYLRLLERLPRNPTARALGDLAAYSLQNTFRKIQIRSDITIPIARESEILELVTKRIKSGFSSFKLKLSNQELSKNVNLVKYVNSLLPENSVLRIDANQAWSVDYSLHFLDAIYSNKLQLEYLEQPVLRENIDGLAEIRKKSPFPIMADESCFNIEDLERIISSNAADWVNVKILKSGGITPAKHLAERVKKAGLKLSIGCMIESPLGVRAAMELAWEFDPNRTHDLDAAWWYPQDELVYSNGIVS